MEHKQRPQEPQADGQVIDFDEALLDACAPDVRAELITEAGMLAEAFAPSGRAEQLRIMAQSLCEDGRDSQMERSRARRLAAALRRLAREAEG